MHIQHFSQHKFWCCKLGKLTTYMLYIADTLYNLSNSEISVAIDTDYIGSVNTNEQEGISNNINNILLFHYLRIVF